VIIGGHVIVFSADPETDRAFLTTVLEAPYVDAGGGWLVVKLPPSEIAVHPADGPPRQEFYLMSDDLDASVERVTAAGASCAEITEARWGRLTRVSLPGGGEVGLYEPRHPLAIDL
jgi:hypothetical protein